jgi:hypothetical protein
MPEISKDNYTLLLLENEQLRRDNAALTSELGLLRAKYVRDVHGFTVIDGSMVIPREVTA